MRDLASATAVLSHYVYDTFGKITSTAKPTRYGYTGREWDESAGLYYYRARWYDASTGRFISQDPIGFAAGDGNLYRYVGNGPVDRTDPSGEWWGIDDLIASVGGAVVGVVAHGISDLVSGHASSWESYVGAAAGGAAAGETLLLTGSPTLAGLAGGAVGNAVTQGLSIAAGDQESFDVGSLVQDAAIGAVGGYVGGAVGGKVFDAVAPNAGGVAASYVSGKVGGGVAGAVVGGMNAYASGGDVLTGMGVGALSGSVAGGIGGLGMGMAYDSGYLGGPVTVSRWGRPGLQDGDWVMPGGVTNPRNYILSGKWDPGLLGNDLAWPSSGSEYEVPASSVRWPQGSEGYKGLVGQRQYVPTTSPDGVWVPENAMFWVIPGVEGSSVSKHARNEQ